MSIAYSFSKDTRGNNINYQKLK